MANRLEPRRQVGDGESDGGATGQVETQLLELVLCHLLSHAKPLADTNRLRDGFLALPHDGKLTLEETAVLDAACVLEEPPRLVRRAAQRGALGVVRLLLEIGLTRRPDPP